MDRSAGSIRPDAPVAPNSEGCNSAPPVATDRFVALVARPDRLVDAELEEDVLLRVVLPAPRWSRRSLPKSTSSGAECSNSSHLTTTEHSLECGRQELSEDSPLRADPVGFQVWCPGALAGRDRGGTFRKVASTKRRPRSMSET
jgi:hypothetical protein